MTKTKNTCRERVSTLHENLVISYEEGDILGKVGEVYFDKQTCQIKGISVMKKFQEPGDKNFVKFEAIHKLGNSVVIVSNEEAVEAAPEGLAGSSLRALNGLKIATEAGEHLGEMSDVNVIAETGVVQDILVFGDRKIPVEVEKDELSIGPHMIVVPASYKDKITANPPVEPEGDFGDIVKSAGEATRKFADSISAAVQKVAGLIDPDESEAEAGSAKKTADADKSASQGSPKKTATKKTAPAAKKAAPAAKKAAPAKKK